MPRIRGLKPDAFKDEDLSILPIEVRYFFMGLWCYADKQGRLEDRPKFLKAELFPYDDVDVEGALAALANPTIPERPEKTFIRRYKIDGRKYIDIPNFLKHQRPHHTEKASVIPPYEDSITVKEPLLDGKYQEESVVCSLSIEKESESVHREGEGKGGRGKGRTEKPPSPLSIDLNTTDKEQKRKAELRAQIEQLRRDGQL